MLNSLEEFALTKDLYLEVTDITQTDSVLREKALLSEEEIADKYSFRIKECIRVKIPYILLVWNVFFYFEVTLKFCIITPKNSGVIFP